MVHSNSQDRGSPCDLLSKDAILALTDMDLDPETGQLTTKASILRRLLSAVSRPQNRDSTKADQTTTSLRSTEQDPEKGNYSKTENEEACAKIWSIYVGEAERYDMALVESWKADMEGMLIFSGLFSASLTAFLIESYKNLQPDSGDLTVAAILQVSQQLAALANGGTFVAPTQASFTPSTESLLCNALWFISLSLSLTCALLATLVEQWAREFMHRTEMRPSPVRRARIFSYLYFGLKRFRMHTIVDAIPFLLHASLLLFFAGLVAFLLPVNRVMMSLMCIALGTFFLLYAILTVLPVIRLDCPYRTPLVAPLWSLVQNAFNFLEPQELLPQRTMTEAVVDSALRDTQDRDQHAIQWTLGSLTDDVDLLPFVEAIPDIIHGPKGFRRVNDDLFIPILGDTEVPSPLVTRICNLVAGTRGMSPDDPLAARRCIAGQKALWALCMMPCAWECRFDIDPRLVPKSWGGLPATASLAIQYHAQRWSHHLVERLRDLLVINRDRSSAHFQSEVLPTLLRLLRVAVEHENIFVFPIASNFRTGELNACASPFAELKGLCNEIGNTVPTPLHLDRAERIIAALHDSHDWATNSIGLIENFLKSGLFSFRHGFEPLFKPLITCGTILSNITANPPRQVTQEMLALRFPQDVHKIEFSWQAPSQLDILARIAFRLLPFRSSGDTLRQSQPYRSYLVGRRNTKAIWYALQDCNLAQLAVSLGDFLSFEISRDDGQNGGFVDEIIHATTVIANCIPRDSVAIEFMDTLLVGKSPDLISRHSTIWAVRHLRRLRQLDSEIVDVDSLPPESVDFARLQEICHNELLRPLCPLFLPKEVNINMVVNSLRNCLFNRYIEFLSDFLVKTTPTDAKVAVSAFNALSFYYSSPWLNMDPEIQSLLFKAILEATKNALHFGSGLAVLERLWCSDPFWDRSEASRWGPRIFGIEPACLRLLVESLELYHRAAESQPEDGTFLDTTVSNMILIEVRKELEGQKTPTDPPSVLGSETDAENGEDISNSQE
ncbi:hypothetical protein MVEN_01605100 [Mycena venus]|uniref:DUF6535 domain-containing protein n=1 Tax=Mycena venus TaxID=2733690 RepID=A0A8H7CRT9_9AGAR|nr:hypothetical protein MVEN_01605100 [Mycena venus]